MKIFQKVLAVVCAFAVAGTMVLPGSMLNSITYAEDNEDNEDASSANDAVGEGDLVVGSSRTDLNITEGGDFKLNAHMGNGEDTYKSNIKFEYDDSEFKKTGDFYSEIYSEITLRALKQGNFEVTVRDEDTGASETVPITVCAKSDESCSLFDVPIIDEARQTAFARNGLYVEAPEYGLEEDQRGNEYYSASFEVYNERASYGIVEVYDEKGGLISAELLSPAEGLSDDTWADSFGVLAKLGGEILFPVKTGEAGHTSVELTYIPKGGSVKITNDPLESDALFLVCAADIITRWYGVNNSSAGFNAGARDKFNNAALTEIAAQRKAGKISVSSAVKSVKSKLAADALTPEALAKIMASNGVVKALKNALLNIDYSDVEAGYTKKEVEKALSKASKVPNEIKNIADSVFGKNGAVEFYRSACALTDSTGGGAVSVFVPSGVSLSDNNVSVSGELDSHTSLNAERIEFDENIKNCLPPSLSEIPGEYVFVYDISLYNGDQTVQPNGDVTVSIAIPDALKPYADDLRVYRIETDNTATQLKTTVADGKISFATSHFSDYVLTPARVAEQAALTISIPDGVKVFNSLDRIVKDGDEINTGDVLSINAVPPTGQRVASLTVNGSAITNGSDYTVGTSDVIIAVTFENEQPDDRFRISIPQNVVVTRGGTALRDGDSVYKNDPLNITATPPSGKELASLTVNGAAFRSGSVYTVGSADVKIEVSFKDAVPVNYKITIPQNVTVTRRGAVLKNGDTVQRNDSLNIVATAPQGKEIAMLYVNGAVITNNSVYVVGDRDVNIEVTFRDASGNGLKITIPQNVTVTRNNTLLGSGAEIKRGDSLRISAVPPKGKKVATLTVNGTAIQNNSNYVVGNTDVTIAVTFENESAADNLKITIPQNVTVSSGGVMLKSGDTIRRGDTLYISATAPNGKKIASLTVNDTEIGNNAFYIVGDKNIVIAIKLEDTAAANLKVSIPQNVTVTKGGAAVKNGDTVRKGDALRIKATAPNGKKLKSLTVNGAALRNDSVYTVGDSNVDIKVVFEDDKTAVKYHVMMPDLVTVKRGSSTLKNGDEIKEGETLTITANVPDGYKLGSLTVNGRYINSGDTYRVEKKDAVIKANFEKLPADTKQPFIVSRSDIVGWNNITNELGSSWGKSVMVDMNGTTVAPADVLRATKNNNVNLILKMNDRVSWSIDGGDISRVDRDVDFNVATNTNNISEDQISNFIGDRDHLTLATNHNGDLGMTAYLVLDVGEQYNGEPATLYWYNNNTFSREDSADVQYGKAVLKFTHASDWLIAFGKTSNRPTNKPDPDDTSRPIDSRPNEPKPEEPDNRPSITDPDDDNENPDTGSPRVSLFTFLALVTSAAVCLFARKQKR